MKNKSIDRPSSEEIKQNRSARKRAQRELLKQQKAQGLVASHRVSIPNRVCQFENAEEEQASRQDAAIEQARILRAQLPTLLERLEKIEDLRNPKKIKHKLTVLLIYGILTFVFQRASRREANRTLTRPVFMENLKLLFPDLESIPHHDTLYRLLCDIDVNEIEAAHVDVVRRFIVNKNFRRYLIANSYPIAIDGSQKLVRDSQWCEETLQREVRKEGEDNALQHYVYVLEANLAFHNGMTIPLMSEFLTYPDGDIKNAKQDCEQKAFHRLAGRLRGKFSHLPLMVLLDGLYPNGPIMALCRKMNWDVSFRQACLTWPKSACGAAFSAAVHKPVAFYSAPCYLCGVDVEVRYRGRVVTADDVERIRKLIADHPSLSRRGLSLKFCEVWNWVQPNGAPRDMVARGLLLELHRRGLIELPAQKWVPRSMLREHRPQPSILTWLPIEEPLVAIRPLEIRQVRRTSEEALFNSFIETHHYLGYIRPVGEHLKYLISAKGVPIACMSWSSAPRHIGVRDRFIGWTQEVRRQNMHLVAYNSRFLILPWGRVPHLASHVLGLISRRISADWERLYHHPIVFLETFVDPERFRGTCYRAANWIHLGVTKGVGKASRTMQPDRSLKEVLGYPLVPDFRKRLGVT